MSKPWRSIQYLKQHLRSPRDIRNKKKKHVLGFKEWVSSQIWPVSGPAFVQLLHCESSECWVIESFPWYMGIFSSCHTVEGDILRNKTSTVSQVCFRHLCVVSHPTWISRTETKFIYKAFTYCHPVYRNVAQCTREWEELPVQTYKTSQEWSQMMWDKSLSTLTTYLFTGYAPMAVLDCFLCWHTLCNGYDMTCTMASWAPAFTDGACTVYAHRGLLSRFIPPGLCSLF